MPSIPNLTPDPNLPTYRFNEAANRYIAPNGRFVSSGTIRNELDRVLDASTENMAKLSQGLREGRISLGEWQTSMMQEVKTVHIVGAAMERGGFFNMTQADFGRVGQIVRREYGFLRDFANDIASGKQKLDGILVNRARLYGQAGRDTYQTFARNKAANSGFDRVMSIRHAKDSCSECVYFDRREYPIDSKAYKPPGRRICRSNCHCSEKFFNSATEQERVV